MCTYLHICVTCIINIAHVLLCGQGSVFHTYGNEKLNQDYFLESAATVKFFLEADAVHKVASMSA